MCEYVSLYGERDFIVMIRLRILTRKMSLDYPGGPNVIPRGLIREKREGQSQRRGDDKGSKSQRYLKMLHSWL